MKEIYLFNSNTCKMSRISMRCNIMMVSLLMVVILRINNKIVSRITGLIKDTKVGGRSNSFRVDKVEI